MHIIDGLKFWLQIGFLYLRYAADPKTLWTWFEPYIKDEEVTRNFGCLNVLWRLKYSNMVNLSKYYMVYISLVCEIVGQFFVDVCIFPLG